MYEDILNKLSASPFRSRFKLTAKDKAYVQLKGLKTIRQHAADFISKRVAPASLTNDGRQTPMRGHPVFLAQHATACCCRGCIYKWHHYSKKGPLNQSQQDYLVGLIMKWIENQIKRNNDLNLNV